MRDDVKGGAHRLKPMHRTAAERKKMDSPVATSGKKAGKSYGWGTQMNLDHDDLEKLGIAGTHKVGHEVAIHARARVTSASEHDDETGGKRRSMSLQVTHMGVGAPQTPKAPGKVRRFTAATPKAPAPTSKISKLRRA